MRKLEFQILTEDIERVETLSPHIFRSLERFFSFHRVYNKAAKISYYLLRLRFRCLHHANKRAFHSLIHSVHVVACDLYKREDFTSYMAFDALLVHLVHML